MEESGLGRFSELPDSLIFHILSFLPIGDVIRTTLLGKAWKGLWTTIPYLNFEMETRDANDFRNFVNRALILWKGTKILKFDIVICYRPLASYDVDLWLHVAMENGVEELNLNLLNVDDVDFGYEYDDTEYYAPRRLYSCSFIKKLSLVACNLLIHGNVRWDHLKFLSIAFVDLSEHVILQILSGSPQLEELSLCICDSNENLTIRSSSLKRLTIEKYLCRGELPSYNTVLTIWAPNVETLELYGTPYSESMLMNVSSVTDATLDFHVRAAISYNILFEDMLRQVFQSIHHFGRVTFSNWCLKALARMKKLNLLTPPSEAKYLKLYAAEIDEIVDLLGVFPKLTMLVIENVDIEVNEGRITEPDVFKFDEENPVKLNKKFLELPCLLQLKTIEVTWIASDVSVYPLIEFLLKDSSMLEKLVFWAPGFMLLPLQYILSDKQKLLRKPRSSPTARNTPRNAPRNTTRNIPVIVLSDSSAREEDSVNVNRELNVDGMAEDEESDA